MAEPPSEELSDSDARWLYEQLRKRAERALSDAQKSRLAIGVSGHSSLALHVLSDADEQAAKAYNRAINQHLLRKIRLLENLRRFGEP